MGGTREMMNGEVIVYYFIWERKNRVGAVMMTNNKQIHHKKVLYIDDRLIALMTEML